MLRADHVQICRVHAVPLGVNPDLVTDDDPLSGAVDEPHIHCFDLILRMIVIVVLDILLRPVPECRGVADIAEVLGFDDVPVALDRFPGYNHIPLIAAPGRDIRVNLVIRVVVSGGVVPGYVLHRQVVFADRYEYGENIIVVLVRFVHVHHIVGKLDQRRYSVRNRRQLMQLQIIKIQLMILAKLNPEILSELIQNIRFQRVPGRPEIRGLELMRLGIAAVIHPSHMNLPKRVNLGVVHIQQTLDVLDDCFLGRSGGCGRAAAVILRIAG